MTATFRRFDPRTCSALRLCSGLTSPSVLLAVLWFSHTILLGVPLRAQSTPSAPKTPSSSTTKTSAPVNDQASATPLDPPGMQQEFERLDAICQRLGLEQERQLMSRWIMKSGDDSQRLYLPLAQDPLASNQARDKSTADKHANWLKYFNAARERHAAYWYEQAEKQVAAGDEWAAYRALWRAAREDESHAATKRALGPLLTAINVKTRPKTINAVHAQLKWPAGSYSRIETANFRLTSRADVKTTIEIANQLEAFYALWTQAFYPLWAAPNVTSSRIAGRNPNWSRRNACEVILCKDRDDYIKTLGVSEANIGVSVGYYNPEAKMSFFYPDAQLDATLYHELTHQLLSEVSQLKSSGQPGEEQDFWIVEGVALHAESLRRDGLDWSLGGWLSPRLQTARYRSLHDGYWIDWRQLSEMGLEQWKSNPEIGKLYSHASGLSHFFLDQRLAAVADERNAEPLADFDTHASHAAFFFALVGVYQGNRGATNKLQTLLGGDDAQKSYVNYLLVRDRHLQSLAALDSKTQASVRDLVLTRSQLAASSWQQLAKLTRLQWLDCSFTNIKAEDVTWIDRLEQLERLSLEGTAVDGSIVAKIARLPRLMELDLSQCSSIDDSALKSLARHPTLQTLWLTGTSISGDSVSTIESIPRLTYVEVSNTRLEKVDAERLGKRYSGK